MRYFLIAQTWKTSNVTVNSFAIKHAWLKLKFTCFTLIEKNKMQGERRGEFTVFYEVSRCFKLSLPEVNGRVWVGLN